MSVAGFLMICVMLGGTVAGVRHRRQHYWPAREVLAQQASLIHFDEYGDLVGFSSDISD